MLERDWKGLLDVSENLEPHDWPFFRAVDSAYLGIALSNLGEEARARSAFEASRQELEELMIDDPGVFVRQVYGWVSAMLGDQEVAFQLADEMVSDNPDDHYFRLRYLGVKAQLYVLGGANDRAIDVLEEALHTPYSFPGGVSTLRLDPIWDALREEPRFQALLEDHTHPLIDRR
jgi:serine/threonine-protein kinase